MNDRQRHILHDAVAVLRCYVRGDGPATMCEHRLSDLSRHAAVAVEKVIEEVAEQQQELIAPF